MVGKPDALSLWAESKYKTRKGKAGGAGIAINLPIKPYTHFASSVMAGSLLRLTFFSIAKACQKLIVKSPSISQGFLRVLGRDNHL
jgi:hypothetical protein